MGENSRVKRFWSVLEFFLRGRPPTTPSFPYRIRVELVIHRGWREVTSLCSAFVFPNSRQFLREFGSGTRCGWKVFR